MTTYTVSSGHTSSGITLNPGDTMTVRNGGTAVDTTDAGFQDVFGKTIGTVINNGTEWVESGGVASGTILNGNGAEFVVGVGATVSGAVFNDNSDTYLEGAITVIGSVINSGSLVDVSFGGTTTGSIINNGGAEYVEYQG